MRRLLALGALALFAVSPAANAAGTGGPSAASQKVQAHVQYDRALSAGARAWLFGPPTPVEQNLFSALTPSFGSNVDAAEPQEDLAGGQSETAIAAANAGGQRRVLAAWNDASAFAQPNSTLPRGSGTGVGYSSDGGQHFRDLIGLPNLNPNQQWSGDPSVVRIDGSHFAVGSLYFPSFSSCGGSHPAPAFLTAAVSIATVSSDGSTVHFGQPVMGPSPGNVCSLFGTHPPDDLALIDKPFLAYDRTSHTLAMSYTRFFLLTGSGAGQIEMIRAHMPSQPQLLSHASFSAPIVIWPEQHHQVNSGAYPAVTPNGDTYVAWERNIDNVQTASGDPFVHEQIARVPAGSNHVTIGGPANPRVVTLGQRNSNLTRRRSQPVRAADRRLQPRHRQRLPADRLRRGDRSGAGRMERRQPAPTGRHLDAGADAHARVRVRDRPCQRRLRLHAALPARDQRPQRRHHLQQLV